MKQRKLKLRGLIRYFRDDGNSQLWRFKAGKMERIHPETNSWIVSSRSPEKVNGHYENNWREITPNMAKRNFPRFFRNDKIKGNNIIVNNGHLDDFEDVIGNLDPIIIHSNIKIPFISS